MNPILEKIGELTKSQDPQEKLIGDEMLSRWIEEHGRPDPTFFTVGKTYTIVFTVDLIDGNIILEPGSVVCKYDGLRDGIVGFEHGSLCVENMLSGKRLKKKYKKISQCVSRCEESPHHPPSPLRIPSLPPAIG